MELSEKKNKPKKTISQGIFSDIYAPKKEIKMYIVTYIL